MVGAATGISFSGNQTDNALTGAIIGGVVGGVASYLIHGSLETRDERVRRDTLMNLEHYEVLGITDLKEKPISTSNKKCLTTHVVDGRLVSLPCELAPDLNEDFN